MPRAAEPQVVEHSASEPSVRCKASAWPTQVRTLHVPHEPKVVRHQRKRSGGFLVFCPAVARVQETFQRLLGGGWLITRAGACDGSGYNDRGPRYRPTGGVGVAVRVDTFS